MLAVAYTAGKDHLGFESILRKQLEAHAQIYFKDVEFLKENKSTVDTGTLATYAFYIARLNINKRFEAACSFINVMCMSAKIAWQCSNRLE